MNASRLTYYVSRLTHTMSRFHLIAGLTIASALAVAPSALGYTPIGPPPALTPNADQWEIGTVGFMLPGDVGTPKNIGEAYRRNTPVLYYACDDNFLGYFGSNGLAQVDAAFAIYNSLTNVSSFSSDLHEFPTMSMQYNYVAQNLSLVDLKSEIMWLIAENLGLAEPERYIWCIHDRYIVSPPGCPVGCEYLLVQRNFDPTLGLPPSQVLTSSYVNDILYTYEIIEICTGPNPLAIATPFAVDPTQAGEYTSLAGALGNETVDNFFGLFFTGLTRDDAGGLRYLLSSNNIAYESTGTNTTVEVPSNTPQLLFTSNLTLLAQQAFTNSPIALEALFPGLVVSGSTSNWVNILTTNVTITFTNAPFMPALFPPTVPVYHTNITINVTPWYHHTFANLEAVVLTNGVWEGVPITDLTLFSNYSAMLIQTQTLALVSPPDAPEDLFELVTNTTQRTVALGQVSGEYFILPTNLCGIGNLQLQASFISTYTNILGTGTNAAAGAGGTTPTVTNIVGNTIPLAINAFEIGTFTNFAFVYLPINCVVDNTGLYEGVEKLNFYRVNFDSLTGRFFNPVTNQYTMYEVTNGTVLPQKVVRTVTTPDFIITATDLTAGGGAIPATPLGTRNINFNPANVGAGLAGPGTIDPSPVSATFTLNKSGPIFLNSLLLSAFTNAFVNNELNQEKVWGWGSFDGTTNLPVVYPNGATLANLLPLTVIQITPTYLPAASVGVLYSEQLQAVGQSGFWQGPITWVLTANSTPLPPGLTLSSTGLISGTPTSAGAPNSLISYNFVVQVTDSIGHTATDTLYITVSQ